MTGEFIDTHCHLDYEPLSPAVEAVLARAREAGVTGMLTVGTTVERSRASIVLAQQYPMLRAAVGIHPNDSDEATDQALAEIDALAASDCVAAIGEIGLDFYRDHAAPERQRQAFGAFLEIAHHRDLPVAIHCRDAYEELLRVLQAHRSSRLRGVIHCASGPPQFIEGALALGFHISFSGTVTFPNAQATRALVPLVPDGRLLIETDAPFLAPQPARGRPNEPAYVVHTAARLAEIRGTTVEAIGELTTRNARTLFGFPSASP